ncbi:MAG: hypothetical protein L0154_12225 [Chloroflexi bacterium]|nr:hypothetical protein [Chloroflexota bacterium]
MRKLILLMVMVAIVGWWQPPVEAKAIVERLVITSPALSEDIIVDDDRWVSLLGTYSIRDPQLKLDERPVDIGVGYEVERQFARGDDFLTLDHFEYYPGTTKQHGYIHFRWHLGSRNDRSDDLEGDWYHVHLEAELALNHILNSQHLNNYLIVYGGEGNILLLDPHSLDIQFTLDTQQEEWSNVADSGASFDGTRLFFQTTSSETGRQNVLDLSAMESCSLGASVFVMPTLDGNHLLFQVGNTLHVRDAKTYDLVETVTLEAESNIYFSPDNRVLEGFSAVWNDETQQLEFIQQFEFIRMEALHFNVTDNSQTSELQRAGVAIEAIGSYQGRLYFYPRLGRYQIWDTSKVDDVDGGIISSLRGGLDIEYERILPEIHFQHVIMAGNTLYALETPFESDVSTIYRLDINTGGILNAVDVPRTCIIWALRRLIHSHSLTAILR